MSTRWLPRGYYLMCSNRRTPTGWRWAYRARADGIPEYESEYLYPSERVVKRAALAYLRREALARSKTGWSATGCAHAVAVIDGQAVAFCGVEVGEEPDLSGKEIPKCGRCQKILEGLEEAQL